MTRATRFFTLFLALYATHAVRADLPKVPEGFEVRLVASVPAVEFPCQVATAPGGVLFVAEDPMDQRGPYEAFDGRILLFRDGADPIVFADKFRAIQGMAWFQGSLYVCHMPFLTIVRDANGDGMAEERTDLFKDLGPTNNRGLNDHIVSGLQFGMDGWLYISVGDKGVPGATRVEDGQIVQLRGGGVLRCRPDGRELEVFTSGTRNHLEANLDAADNVFSYDNTDDGDGWWTRVTHHIYDGYYGYPYDYHKHPERFLPPMGEFGGGSPCGAVFYRGDVWPEKYRGIGLWAEWGKGKVHAFRFEPVGASFKIAEDIDFATGNGVGNFHPIDLAVSDDDRTLFVADWNMGGWENKTEKVGRIWAISPTSPAPGQPRGTDADPVPGLIASLDHPSYQERIRAQRALIRRGPEAIREVTTALRAEATSPLAKRHLIWTLDGLVGATPEGTQPLLEQTLSSVADVRAQSARALGQRRVPIALDAFIGLLTDAEPTVRLQGAIGLNRLADERALGALLPVLVDSDPFVAFAARRAMRSTSAWKALTGPLDSISPLELRQVILASEGVYKPDAVDLLRRIVSRAALPEAERAQALGALAQVVRRAKPWNGSWWGTRPSQGKPPAKTEDWECTEQINEAMKASVSDSSAAVRAAGITALIGANERSASELLRNRLTTENDGAVRAELVRALGVFEDKPSVTALAAILKHTSESDEVRDAVIEALDRIGAEVSAPVLLELLNDQGLASARTPRVLAVLGKFHAKSAVPRMLELLTSGDEAIRAAAAQALGAAADRAEASGPLRSRLNDPSPAVRRAVILALGQLDDHDSVPELLTACDDVETRFEGFSTLAKLTDVRALRIYLKGLSDKNADLRRESAGAIGRLRDELVPTLEELADRKEIPPSIVPELRKIYAALEPITSWKIVGPFARGADLPFDLQRVPDFDATFHGLNDQLLSWRNVDVSRRKGVVDCNRLFGGDQRAAFAYAELDSPQARAAELVLGSDDTLTVWLNGIQVYESQSDRGFSREQDRVQIRLVQGTNRLVAQCSNSGGAWEFAVSLSAATEHRFLIAPAEGAFNPEVYALYAREREGDPARGQALFVDLKGLACVKCHKAKGQGGEVGPDLSGVGAQYKREELIESVLYPSARVFSGYETVFVATREGQVLTGIIKSEDEQALVLQDADAKMRSIPKGEIEERRASGVSLMPNGLAAGLTPQDFADLIRYLESLQDAKAPAH
jgi:putative membrane-bound dehydrogenase-like protein